MSSLASFMKLPKTPKSALPDVRGAHHPAPPAPFGEPAVQSSPGGFPPRKRILLVDDDPTVRDSLRDVLVAEGYFVLPAEDGQQALNVVGNFEVDLVLLDLNMPVKNGWDTFAQLTSENPCLPIIIITARPNQWFTALGAGVGALMEKPMDIPALLQTMTALLAEPAELRLARLTGEHTDFRYLPSAEQRRGGKA